MDSLTGPHRTRGCPPQCLIVLAVIGGMPTLGVIGLAVVQLTSWLKWVTRDNSVRLWPLLECSAEGVCAPTEQRNSEPPVTSWSLFRDLPQLAVKLCKPTSHTSHDAVVFGGVGGPEPKLQAIPVQVQVLQTHHLAPPQIAIVIQNPMAPV